MKGDEAGARASRPRIAPNVNRSERSMTRPTTDRTTIPPTRQPSAESFAIAGEDPAEIARRITEFEEDIRPRNAVGRFLSRRAALLSVRLDRCMEFDAAATGKRVRDAEVAYEDERLAYLEKMADWLAAEPTTHLRRLRMMPEGVAWLILSWLAVKADLFHPTRDVWGYGHRQRIDNLMGRRPEEIPLSPVTPLCLAAWGDFSGLTEDQGGGLAAPARKEWARGQLGLLIDAQVAALERLKPTLDQDRIAKDRAEAAARALFDASPASVLARKYEAATERSFYRALRELRQLDAPASSPIEPEPPTPGRGSMARSVRIPEPEGVATDPGAESEGVRRGDWLRFVEPVGPGPRVPQSEVAADQQSGEEREAESKQGGQRPGEGHGPGQDHVPAPGRRLEGGRDRPPTSEHRPAWGGIDRDGRLLGLVVGVVGVNLGGIGDGFEEGDWVRLGGAEVRVAERRRGRRLLGWQGHQVASPIAEVDREGVFVGVGVGLELGLVRVGDDQLDPAARAVDRLAEPARRRTQELLATRTAESE